MTVFITMASGLLGGVLFSLLDLPLPWMLGAIFGVILASRSPISMERPHRNILIPARIVLGLAIGSKFSAGLLEDITQYAVSLMFLLPYVAVTGIVGWTYFRRVAGLDSATAFLCSMPGGIAELLLVGEELKADIRKVALIQGVRILALVYTLPFVASALDEVEIGGNRSTMPGALESDISALALLFAVGIVGWLGFKALKISGAPIVGPMVCAALLSISGWLTQGPPDELFKAAQWLLGSSIGGIFIGYSARKMLQVVRQCAGFLVLLALVTPLTAWTVSSLTDFTFVSALLAFAPGGQAEMSLISILLGENTGYVALHHLFRLILIVSLIPVLARRIFFSNSAS